MEIRYALSPGTWSALQLTCWGGSSSSFTCSVFPEYKNLAYCWDLLEPGMVHQRQPVHGQEICLVQEMWVLIYPFSDRKICMSHFVALNTIRRVLSKHQILQKLCCFFPCYQYNRCSLSLSLKINVHKLSQSFWSWLRLCFFWNTLQSIPAATGQRRMLQIIQLLFLKLFCSEKSYDTPVLSKSFLDLQYSHRQWII